MGKQRYRQRQVIEALRLTVDLFTVLAIALTLWVLIG